MPAPFSNCREDVSTYASDTDSIYYVKAVNYTMYSQSFCLEICFNDRKIKTTCNCSDLSVQGIDINEKICSSFTDLSCINSVRNKYDMKAECEQYCPQECDYTQFSTSISSLDYPTAYYYNIISQQNNLKNIFQSSLIGNASVNLDYNMFTQTVLAVSIFYEDLSYTFIEESQAVTIDTLTGVLGGQTGLFLGASALSIFEFVELFVNLLLIFCDHKLFKKAKIAHSK